MSIPAAERDKMLSVPVRGARVANRLERIGIQSLADLAGRDSQQLVLAVNHSVGHPIWHAPIAAQAMANLIDSAGPGSDASCRVTRKRVVRAPEPAKSPGPHPTEAATACGLLLSMQTGSAQRAPGHLLSGEERQVYGEPLQW